MSSKDITTLQNLYFCILFYVIHVYESPSCFDVIPSNNEDNFLQQDNTILLCLESLNK